jgi:rhodanese-related sulfurtransferase
MEWLLVFALLAAVFVVRGKLLARGVPQYRSSDVSRKRGAGEPLVLLDVRTASERSAGSIKGSIHIPLQDLPRRLPELEASRGSEIVCYCASGARSGSAAHLLKRKGFRAANLAGGIAGWREGA